MTENDISDHDRQIDELEKRLEALVHSQIDFQREVSFIKGELRKLRAGTGSPRAEQSFYKPPERTTPPTQPAGETPRPKPPIRETQTSASYATENASDSPPFVNTYYRTEEKSEPRLNPVSDFAEKHVENARADLEKFIGENLISKIGILILIIGVGIGVKYSIDNNLISPLTRIILGYVFGFGLLGLAFKLKPKYHNFSAVLVSGGMAIMYFVTYFGYSLYLLLNQASAFGLMAMFTVFTVAAAIVYNRQVIAHIGLVGAYAVPFLLSNDSGNYPFLFTYMSVINAGILAISVKRYWIPLFYTSFAFTWLIFGGWLGAKYSPEHIYLALVFLAVFFIIFITSKVIQRTLHSHSNELEVLAGAFLSGLAFYVFCFGLSSIDQGDNYIVVLFTYIALLTTGVIVLSFKVFGKPLVYLAFISVWLIYAGWYGTGYDPVTQLATASIFAAVFFATFYATTIAYKLLQNSFSVIENSALLLTNSFVFYGYGYSILDGQEFARTYLGLFTAAHSGLHLAVAGIVSQIRESAVDIIQILTILILTFATIAIPVQFDGNFVTMIWAVQAALLFWYGRTRSIKLFEYFAYPLMVLATGSLFLDWIVSFTGRTSTLSDFNLTPIRNGDFITAIVFLIAFAVIHITNRDGELEPAIDEDFVRPVGYAVATVGLFVFYNMFRIEIDNYFHLRSVELIATSDLDLGRKYVDNFKLNAISQVNYTMLFLSVMGVVNLIKLRSRALGIANVVLATGALFCFCTILTVFFDALRQSYMAGAETGDQPSANIAIRYISYIFAAALIYVLSRYSVDSLLEEYIETNSREYAFEAILYSTLFVAASGELINVMGQYQIGDATKLGLSILWGVYALFLVVIGIARDRKHLRVAAMVLLGVTLAKLFFYDITELGTIPKTILFVTLGITLLAISFLYNKYKNVIFGKREGESNYET